MPSYLHPYQTRMGDVVIPSATKQSDKFLRAVESFLGQRLREAELIIVADGCEITEGLVHEHFEREVADGKIHLVKIEKQPPFSGVVRQKGLEKASGGIICYLDTDDVLGENHLSSIVKQFDTKKYDWVYYDDYIQMWDGRYRRETFMRECNIGTSSIAHKQDMEFVWQDGYNHDFKTIKKYLFGKPFVKIDDCEYYVCHAHYLGVDV